MCVTYKEAGGGEEKKSSFNVLSARQGIYRENTQVIGDTTDRFVPRKREQTSNEFAFRIIIRSAQLLRPIRIRTIVRDNQA